MDKVNNIVREVVKDIIPFVKILLFGSRARNDENSQSDYDFLIVTSNEMEAKEKISLRSRIRKKLLEKGIRSDILIQSEEELKAKNQIPGHIVKSILKEGVAI
jgi:predicted nucleotidyltransferase